MLEINSKDDMQELIFHSHKLSRQIEGVLKNKDRGRLDNTTKLQDFKDLSPQSFTCKRKNTYNNLNTRKTIV